MNHCVLRYFKYFLFFLANRLISLKFRLNAFKRYLI